MLVPPSTITVSPPMKTLRGDAGNCNTSLMPEGFAARRTGNCLMRSASLGRPAAVRLIQNLADHGP